MLPMQWTWEAGGAPLPSNIRAGASSRQLLGTVKPSTRNVVSLNRVPPDAVHQPFRGQICVAVAVNKHKVPIPIPKQIERCNDGFATYSRFQCGNERLRI